jgi:hypothetical protein
MTRHVIVLLVFLLTYAASVTGWANGPTRYTNSEWSKLLEGGVNRISSCSPADVYPGSRITIALRGQDRGDEVRIDGLRFQDAAVVVFQPRLRDRNHKIRNSSLNSAQSIILDVYSLTGLPIDLPRQARRIFRESGEYAIMTGYHFMSEEEGLIRGLCVVRYHARR